jgi:hypothetical protein
MMYSPERSGWDVVGQVESGDWSVHRGGKELKRDDSGRFGFFAKRLGETGLTLQKEESEIRIPSAEEAATFGPSGPD